MPHQFRTFAPHGRRSLCALSATVAAVAIFSAALVMLQLSGPPSARATTAAAASIAVTKARAAKTRDLDETRDLKTWDLEPRWWSGNVQHGEPGSMQQLERPAPAAPSSGRTMLAESDLTFAKGYALRLAARRAAAADQVAATVPSTEGKAGTQIARSTPVGRHADAKPRTAAAPTPRRLTPGVHSGVEPAPFDIGSQTLAFDEPRPRHGVLRQSGLFPSIFGTLR